MSFFPERVKTKSSIFVYFLCMNLRWRDDPLSLKFLQTGLLILIFLNNMFFFSFDVREHRGQRMGKLR